MKQRGFTLLEILVVLAVFGLLLAGLSQTMRFGLLAWRQEAHLSDGKTDLEAVDRSVRAIIENLAPADEGARTAIDGTSSALTGRTRLRVPGSGLQAIPIEAGLAVSGTRLVLRWRPYHHGDPLRPAPPPQEAELAGGVARLAISYWQSTGIWTSSWREAELPLLIRLHLTFTGEHPARWPDIVVAPLLSRP